MLWAQPAWQGLRSACLDLPVLPLYALIVGLRLAEVVHRRSAAGADPFTLGWREALEAMFFLSVGAPCPRSSSICARGRTSSPTGGSA